MIGATVAQMANGDAQRYAASLAAFTTTAFCLIAWALRLSALVDAKHDELRIAI
jgi:sulfate permease, SulP family